MNWKIFREFPQNSPKFPKKRLSLSKTSAMIEKAPTSDITLQTQAIEFLVDNKNTDLLSRINKDYLYWDKVKYMAPKGVDPSVVWSAVKIQRHLNVIEVRFGHYVFHFTVTSQMQALLHEFDMSFGGSLGTNSVVPQKNHSVYLVSSIMEEAIASSQMEGASTTRRVAKDMLRKKSKPQNKDQQMILNNYSTIQYIVGHRNDDFSAARLCDIHRSISTKTLDNPEDEGRFRTDDNILVVNGITGDIAHTPPSYTEIASLVNSLCEFANKDSEDPFVHPVIKAIIIHFMLSFIHPFVDGNGRTARSLFYWYMLKKGYWLTEYLSISRVIYKSKAKYEKAFLYVENDSLDLSYFIHFNLSVMRKAFDELKKYLQQKIDEQEDFYTFMAFSNVNERQAKVIRVLNEKPNTMFTVNELTTRFDITAKTARADLKHLVELGLLQPVSINLRTTGYIKSENFETRLKELLNF